MAKKASAKPAAKVEAEEPEETSLATVDTNLPAFLQDEEVVGFAGLEQYQTVPRLRIVQSASGDDLKAVVGEGGIVLRPDNIVVMEPGESFVFTPLFIFTTYEQWRDNNDPDSQMLVVRSTSDPRDSIALKATDPAQWTEEYPDGSGLKYKFVESINVLVLIEDGEAAGKTAILSFNVTAFPIGKALVAMLRARRVALYANRVKLSLTKRVKGRNSWFVPSLNNPTDGAFVTEEVFATTKAMHLDMQAAFDSGAFTFGGAGDDPATEAGADDPEPIDAEVVPATGENAPGVGQPVENGDDEGDGDLPTGF